MNTTRLILAVALSAVAASAHATPCDAVKSQVEAKIKAHGVKAYSLEVVPAAEVKDAKVVGSCEGGARKIVYKRN
jgi:hypothetical protein